jgi:hypothetical protein
VLEVDQGEPAQLERVEGTQAVEVRCEIAR